MKTETATEVFKIIRKHNKTYIAKKALCAIQNLALTANPRLTITMPTTPDELMNNWATSKPIHLTLEEYIMQIMENWRIFFKSEFT